MKAEKSSRNKKLLIIPLAIVCVIAVAWNLYGSTVVYSGTQPYYVSIATNPNFCKADVYLVSLITVSIVNVLCAIQFAISLSAGIFVCVDLVKEMKRQKKLREERLAAARSSPPPPRYDGDEKEMTDWIAMRRQMRSPPSYEEAVAALHQNAEKD